MDKRRIDELGISYVEKLSLYEEYASRIRNLIQDLIEREGVEFHTIEGWAKTPSELLRSLNTMDEDTSLPVLRGEGAFASLDLVTVRVLLRFPEDVNRVEEVVRAEFDVDESRSVPSSGLEDPFRFGYPAVVYTLALSESRSHLREWEKYQGLNFRLELRTMLQDAWAAIAPKVNLSVGTLSEKKLKRKLVRLAALLEEADEGFLSLRDEARGEAFLVPPTSLAGQTREEPIAVERTFTDEELYQFFRGDPSRLSHWNEVAIEAGFPPFSPDPSYLRESFKHLCQILRAAGIDTISEVRDFLAEVDEDGRGLRQLQAVRSAYGQRESASGGANWRMDPFSAIFLLVLNFRWDVLKDKDLVKLNIKRGSDRISGID
ncbi:MAG: RelA/SpoT domain-containing protein [Fretibacterium sp.]|nr:RelA/SpoT domain-containing protein [Fretibacterium sp.]